MIHFIGRAVELVSIENKPAPERFKIRVIANIKYILDFIFYSKGYESPVNHDSYWLEKGFSKTRAVVFDLF